MNRNKYPLDNRVAKKIKKEVRYTQEKYATPEMRTYSDEQTEKELLKKFPKRKTTKIPPKFKPRLASSHQKHAKISKRTTPGEVPSGSSPASIHREGKVWTKTLIKQSLSKRKTLTKKLSKKR